MIFLATISALGILGLGFIIGSFCRIGGAAEEPKPTAVVVVFPRVDRRI